MISCGDPLQYSLTALCEGTIPSKYFLDPTTGKVLSSEECADQFPALDQVRLVLPESLNAFAELLQAYKRPVTRTRANCATKNHNV